MKPQILLVKLDVLKNSLLLSSLLNSLYFIPNHANYLNNSFKLPAALQIPQVPYKLIVQKHPSHTVPENS